MSQRKNPGMVVNMGHDYSIEHLYVGIGLCCVSIAVVNIYQLTENIVELFYNGSSERLL